jgi:hypothetical protein
VNLRIHHTKILLIKLILKQLIHPLRPAFFSPPAPFADVKKIPHGIVANVVIRMKMLR